jgi:polyisoprenoid-binding protein YceI
MSPSRQLTSPALRALRDGKIAGSWTLDPARSQVALKTKRMWGLAPVKGEFRQVTGHGTVSPSGEMNRRTRPDISQACSLQIIKGAIQP